MMLQDGVDGQGVVEVDPIGLLLGPGALVAGAAGALIGGLASVFFWLGSKTLREDLASRDDGLEK